MDDCLYIPHGSDERLADENTIGIWLFLYIPHGSDESWLFTFEFLVSIMLYIPHGSDESLLLCVMLMKSQTLYPTWFRWKLLTEIAEIALKRFYFISHMVQMKVCQHTSSQVPLSALYPTWFRWKLALLIILSNTSSIALYPTWFRWKSLCFFFSKATTSLYIPHGSDERILLFLF